jgi:hypothetical protein
MSIRRKAWHTPLGRRERYLLEDKGDKAAAREHDRNDRNNRLTRVLLPVMMRPKQKME